MELLAKSPEMKDVYGLIHNNPLLIARFF